MCNTVSKQLVKPSCSAGDTPAPSSNRYLYLGNKMIQKLCKFRLHHKRPQAEGCIETVKHHSGNTRNNQGVTNGGCTPFRKDTGKAWLNLLLVLPGYPRQSHVGGTAANMTVDNHAGGARRAVLHTTNPAHGKCWIDRVQVFRAFRACIQCKRKPCNQAAYLCCCQVVTVARFETCAVSGCLTMLPEPCSTQLQRRHGRV